MRQPHPLFLVGVLLGVGVGGLADGICSHQLLQWHHTICDERLCLVSSLVDLRADFH